MPKNKLPDPIGFIEQNLIDPETDRPFVLLPAERQFMKYAFKLDADGRLLYPEQVFAAPKKSGKTTLAALMAIVANNYYGGRHGEVILAANSFEQSSSRVFAMIGRIIKASPRLRDAAKIKQDRIELDGAQFIAIASDAGSAAGANPVASILDELWAYTSEASHRLFDELVPPPTRKVAFRLTVTYAGYFGESTLLEGLYRRGMEQPEVAPSLHAGDGILLAWHTQPVAPWQTSQWVEQMRRSLRPNQFARMILNQFVSAESNVFDMRDFDRCVDRNLKQEVTNRTLPIWVGMDGSVNRDWTAVISVTVDRRTGKLRLVTHQIFKPSRERDIQFEDVLNYVKVLNKRFSIQEVLFDPTQLVAVSQLLIKAGIPARKFNQTGANLTLAGSALFEAVKTGSIAFYEDAEIRTAMSQAVAVEVGMGWKITKAKSSRKIDPVAALSFAVHSAMQTVSEPIGIVELLGDLDILAHSGLIMPHNPSGSPIGQHGGESRAALAMRLGDLVGGGYTGGRYTGLTPAQAARERRGF